MFVNEKKLDYGEICKKDSNVWLIVVTYNAEEWIDNLGTSIQDSLLKPKVIIVDNCSSDKTAEIIKSRFSEFKLIENRRNEGFGKGNNLAMKIAINAGADYVFLLNQDAKLMPSTLTELLSIANSTIGQEYGILTPMQLDYEGKVIDPNFLNYLVNPGSKFISDILFNRRKKVYEFPFLPAAAWLVRCSMLRQIGGFDPVFFMYGEDYDMCIRVKKNGYKIGLLHQSYICHHHGGFPRLQESIQKRIWNTYWQIVVQLKDPDSSFLYALVFRFKSDFFRLLQLIVSGKLRTAYCLMRAWLDVFSNVFVIRENRNGSKLVDMLI